jgi:hypothetical protein
LDGASTERLTPSARFFGDLSPSHERRRETSGVLFKRQTVEATVLRHCIQHGDQHMFDAFARLLDTLATARRVVQPRQGAVEKSTVIGSEFRRRASAIATLIASRESSELAILLVWSLGALCFAFAYGDPQLGAAFPPGIAMN